MTWYVEDIAAIRYARKFQLSQLAPAGTSVIISDRS